MERLFASYDRYIENKLQGNPLSADQKLILAYIIKSEWENRFERHTILITDDNNHAQGIRSLKRAGLISRHPASPPNYPIYIADRVLVEEPDLTPLREFFGTLFDTIDPFSKDILRIVHRFNNYSKIHKPSAKTVAFVLWHESHEGGRDEIREFDRFYRRIRYAFNRLEKSEFVITEGRGCGYQLNPDYRKSHLSF